MFRSPDGDIDFFDSVAGDLKRDTFSLDMFIIGLAYLIKTSKNLKKMVLYTKSKKQTRSFWNYDRRRLCR